MDWFYRWLWYLLPANPIVVRVVQGGSRRARHLWVRMGYLGVMIALVLIGLLAGGGLQADVNITELAKTGTQIFALVSYGQVVFICLLAPLFTAGAIDPQRSEATFDILLSTPLTNLQVVLGTLLSRLYFVLALLLSGLPLFAVLLIFGGVPVVSVFVSFAVAGLTAIVVGAVAVTLNVMRAAGRRAIFTFVIGVSGSLLFFYLLDVALLRRWVSVPDSTTWLTPLHPLLVLEASLNSANYRPPPQDSVAHLPTILRCYVTRPFTTFASLSLTLSGALVVFSAVQLRKVGQEVRFAAVRRWLRLSSGGERRRPPRKVRGNPVAWREAHTRGSRAGAILARWGFVAAGLGAAVALLLLYHFGGLPALTDASGVRLSAAQVFYAALRAMLLLELAVIVLVAIYMSAGAVSKEREDGTLDLMLTTPITPASYVWGKLRGLVSFLGLLLAVPVGTLLLMGLYTMLGVALGWPSATTSSFAAANSVDHELVLFEAGLIAAFNLVPFVALCVMVGMGWSLKARGVLGAVVPSVAIVGLLSMVLGFCGWNMAAGLPVVGPIVNSFSPVTSLMLLVNPWEAAEHFAENPALGRLGLYLGALIAAAGYGLIVYLMRIAMVKSFDHTVRKLSGTG